MEDKQELPQKAGDVGYYFNEFSNWITEHLLAMGLSDFYTDVIRVFILLAIMLLISWIANVIVKRYVVKAIERIIKKTKSNYDDYLIKRRVLNKLSHLVPALIVLLYIGTIFNNSPAI